MRQKNLPGKNYLRIVGLSLIVVCLSSCYIYLRVWFRDLDGEISTLRERNENAERYLATLKTDWISASSIANMEQSISDMKLGLAPTIPAQNLVIKPDIRLDDSRYTGLFKALDKITDHLPIVSSSEAEAKQLFEDK